MCFIKCNNVGKIVDLSLDMEFYVVTIQGIHVNVLFVGVTSLHVYVIFGKQ